MSRNLPQQLRYDKLGPNVVKALQKRNFEAYYCPTKEEALYQAIKLIPTNDIVSWGGSISINEIQLLPYVKEHYPVIDRDTATTTEERLELMRQALLCDTFLMSANAISEDGQLVNIDGNGNRVAAMIYGPKNIIIIAGMNKVVKTLSDAYARARTIAAPSVVQRFPNAKTPCNLTGACTDCLSADSCCAYMVTTRISRPAHKIKVILVGEDLGL